MTAHGSTLSTMPERLGQCLGMSLDAAYSQGVSDLLKIPRWPRWYCSRFLGHDGYLREVRGLDNDQAEYECRACGWRGVWRRPPDKVRALF